MNDDRRALEEILRKITKVNLDYPLPSEWRQPQTSQVAAVCVLFKGSTFSDAQVLLTERSHELPTHAGQVAFPGGVLEGIDEGRIDRAAVRECEEETGVLASKIEVLGQLPPFHTVTGGFEVTPVIGLGKGDLPLHCSEEVAIAEWVSVQSLVASRRIEKYGPVFGWGERKMWGVSAWIFDLILSRYDTLISKEI